MRVGARARLSLDSRKNAIWRDLDHADSAAPTARACSAASRHASACVAAVASMTFSPFVPVTSHPDDVPISPIDQPARYRRRRLRCRQARTWPR
jgi:hypothetical protein